MATDLLSRNNSISNECAMSSRIEINKVKDTWKKEKAKLEQRSLESCYGNLENRTSAEYGNNFDLFRRSLHDECQIYSYSTYTQYSSSEDLLSLRAFHEEIVILNVSTGEGISSNTFTSQHALKSGIIESLSVTIWRPIFLIKMGTGPPTGCKAFNFKKNVLI